MKISKNLQEAALKEALALRNNATPEEVERLVCELVSYSNPRMCIYGQMTGHCNSDRALELMDKCAPMAFNQEGTGLGSLTGGRSKALPTSEIIKNRLGKRFVYTIVSPIEVIISKGDEWSDAVCAVIKGERDTL